MAKVTIKCVDCEASREIGKALLKLVKRCKSCQTKYNRKQARDRYRKLKNIPLSKPVEKEIKKKKAVSIEPEPELEPEPEPEPVLVQIDKNAEVIERTKEEAIKRAKIVDDLIQLGIDQGLLYDFNESDWTDDAKKW